jgi:hypothetical protein
MAQQLHVVMAEMVDGAIVARYGRPVHEHGIHCEPHFEKTPALTFTFGTKILQMLYRHESAQWRYANARDSNHHPVGTVPCAGECNVTASRDGASTMFGRTKAFILVNKLEL